MYPTTISKQTVSLYSHHFTKVCNGLSVVLGAMHAILVILGLVATFWAAVSYGDLLPALVEADGRYIS